MTTATNLERLRQDLIDGAAADIWYDASEYAPEEDEDGFSEKHPDVIALNRIERTQDAMHEAARLLGEMASALKTLREAVSKVAGSGDAASLAAALAQADEVLGEIGSESQD